MCNILAAALTATVGGTVLLVFAAGVIVLSPLLLIGISALVCFTGYTFKSVFKSAEKGMKGVKNVVIKTTRKQGLGYTMTTKTTYDYCEPAEFFERSEKNEA